MVENVTNSILDAINASGISVPASQSVNVHESNMSGINANIISDTADVLEMNKFFKEKYAIYNDVLAPELRKNEKLKREHKTALMENVFKILSLQFKATYIFIALFIIIVTFSSMLNISENIILRILDFLQFYITSIVAELIAILFFIVKNVFDKSIVDLFKNFDKKDSKGSQEGEV